MMTSINEINDLNSHIATAAEEQSSVTEEINHNMSQIQKMIQMLTESAQQTTTSSHSLSEANNQLNKLVSRFKLS